MAATGWTKRHIQRLVHQGKIPPPDIPGIAGHAGKGGKEPGWYKESLPDFLKEKVQGSRSKVQGKENELQAAATGHDAAEGLAPVIETTPAPDASEDIPAPGQGESELRIADCGLRIGEIQESEVRSQESGEKINSIVPGQKLEVDVGPERLLLRRINPQLEELGHLRAGLVLALRRDVPEEHGSRTEALQIFLDTYNAGATYPEIFKRIGPVGRSTLYEWERALRDGGVTNLIPCYGGSGISKVTDEEKTYCLRFALDGNALTKSHSITLAKHTMGKKDIPSPSSPATLRRFLNEFENKYNDLWTVKRKGEKALNDECSPYNERNRRLLQVGEGLVGDGHRLNFQVINPYTGKPCRPMLVLFWDWRSGFPAGWEIMLTENIQAVSSGFRNAILTLGKIPKWVLLDNGRAFRADKMQSKFTLEGTEIEGMFARLGVNVHFAKAYHPQTKPIERFFRTFDEWFERLLPSYVGSSIEKKPAWMKQNEKYHKSIHDGFIPTIEQVNEMMLQWREFYGAQSLAALDGEKPGEIFSAGRGPGVDPVELIFLMMSPEVKQVHRNGVTWIGRNWWCEGLYGYKGKVLIKYSLSDFRQIYVFDLKGNLLGIATPREAVHPMISESENPKDFSAFRRQQAEHQRCRRRTLEDARLYDSRRAVLAPFNGELNPPDVAGFLAKTEQEKQKRLLNPSPWLEGEGQSQPAAEVEEPTLCASKSPLSGPWQPESWLRMEWYERQAPGTLSDADRSWIEDYKKEGEYIRMFESEDGQKRMDFLRSTRPTIQGEGNA